MLARDNSSVSIAWEAICVVCLLSCSEQHRLKLLQALYDRSLDGE